MTNAITNTATIGLISVLVLALPVEITSYSIPVAEALWPQGRNNENITVRGFDCQQTFGASVVH